jgi:hypothetical protein
MLCTPDLVGADRMCAVLVKAKGNMSGSVRNGRPYLHWRRIMVEVSARDLEDDVVLRALVPR